jgi:signal transduction histidine kinase
MKIRATITAWLLLLVLLPTVPLLSFSVYSSYRYADERRMAIETELIQRVDALSSEVRDRLAKSLGYMEGLAVSDAAKEGDIETLYENARRIQELDPTIAAVTLIAPDNRMLFLTLRPFGQQFPASEIPAVRKVFETAKPVLSAPFKSPISDHIVVALGVPVVRDGEVAYCLRAIIRTTVLNSLLQPSQLPNGWIASLVSSEGILVARSHFPERFVGQAATSQLLAALKNRNAGFWDGLTKEGVRTRAILRPVGDWGWYLAMGVSKETLLAPIKRELLKLSLLGVFLLLIGSGTVVLLSRRITKSLRQTVEATQAVLRGASPPVRSTGIVELDQMREALTQVDEYGRLLEQQVSVRTHELVEAKERIAKFATQLEASVESERQRISREVHDQIGAVLTGIKMIFRGLPKASLPEAQEKSLLDALDAGVATARRIAAELRPPLIDDLGLQAAVEQLLDTSLRPARILFSVDLNECKCLSQRHTLGAYRIIQEACTNVVRHSGARHFVVRGAQTSDDNYEIIMTDDGVGMPIAAARKGALGMAGMHERAEIMGGTLACVSTAQHGVTLTLRLPLIGDRGHEDTPA